MNAPRTIPWRFNSYDMVYYTVDKYHPPPEILLSSMGEPGLQQCLRNAHMSGIVVWGLWGYCVPWKYCAHNNTATPGLSPSNYAFMMVVMMLTINNNKDNHYMTQASSGSWLVLYYFVQVVIGLENESYCNNKWKPIFEIRSGGLKCTEELLWKSTFKNNSSFMLQEILVILLGRMKLY